MGGGVPVRSGDPLATYPSPLRPGGGPLRTDRKKTYRVGDLTMVVAELDDKSDPSAPGKPLARGRESCLWCIVYATVKKP